MSKQLRVFVASSSEQVGTANEVAKALRKYKDLDVQVWDQDVFEFSAVYIESLENELERADFAIVVLTADDVGNVRGDAVKLPRDNVIFELGLFTGRLGRERCFFFIDGKSGTRIASDLSGVKAVEFYRAPDASDRRKPGLETQAEKVKKQMLERGARYKPLSEVRRAQEALWRFSKRLSGEWWERIRRGQDDQSTLSHLRISVDAVTNTPSIQGRVYDLNGEPLAKWHTVVTGVILGDRPTVFYRWTGTHDDLPGQTYGGGGQIEFGDPVLETGNGYFYDTNFALLGQPNVTRVKHFRLYRCTPEEVNIMQASWSDDATSLVRRKIAELRGK